MNMQFDYSSLDKILKNYEFKSSNISSILLDTQEIYRYLPKEAFAYFSEKLGMSREKIYSIASFYDNLYLEPKGKYIIKICDGTVCHLRNAVPILKRLRAELGLSEVKITTDDFVFTIESVSCLGACKLAPVITINGKVYGDMTSEKAMEILNTLKTGK